MNKLVFIAALMALATTVIHILATGSIISTPLLSSLLPSATKYSLYLAWHMLTAFFLISTVVMFVSSLEKYKHIARLTVRVLSVIWFVFGILVVTMMLTNPYGASVFGTNQWLLLLPVGILGYFGTICKYCMK